MTDDDHPEAFVLTRVYDAPRELVFEAWTERERLARWWGPRRFTLGVATLELRPGGVFHYSMRSPAGQETWGKFVYGEIAAPERLVYVSSFSDADGKQTRNPMSATWPLEIHNTLTLVEHEGRTTLTLRSVPHGATDEERETFFGAHKNLEQGFKGTLDQLEAELRAARSR